MNSVILVGRLTKEPEIRYIPGTEHMVTNFTLAVDRDYLKKDGSRDTDFIPVEVGGELAKVCGKYLEKGKLIAINGSIKINRYTNKIGENRTFTFVSGKSVQFLSPKHNNTDCNEIFEPSEAFEPDGFQAIDDDEIPF